MSQPTAPSVQRAVPDPHVSVNEAARRLATSRHSVLLLAAEGELTLGRSAGRTVITADSLAAYQRRAGAATPSQAA